MAQESKLFDSLAWEECFPCLGKPCLPWAWLFKSCGQRLFRNSLSYDTPKAGWLFWPSTLQTLTSGVLFKTTMVQERELSFHLFPCIKFVAIGQSKHGLFVKGSWELLQALKEQSNNAWGINYIIRFLSLALISMHLKRWPLLNSILKLSLLVHL